MELLICQVNYYTVSYDHHTYITSTKMAHSIISLESIWKLNRLFGNLFIHHLEDKSNLIILLMQDKKILNEFAAKISKAKILYDATTTNC